MSDKNNNLTKGTLEGLFGKTEKSASKQKKKRNVPTADLELAFTVLLVDMASCDQNFAPDEYLIIGGGLRRLFGTPKERVKALVNQANMVLANLRGTSRFAQLLRDNLDQEEKQAILETLDELIGSDGLEDGFEVYLRTKFADLLGMPTELPLKGE